MRRLLLVGDPHVTVDELVDSQALMDLVCAEAGNGYDGCVILGDLFHNHAVLRVEVLKFWHDALERLGALVPTFVLVGNHDRPNDASVSAHALQTLKLKGVDIVDRPVVREDVLLMPYYHDREAFVKDVVSVGPKTVICHQTFVGSTYENGFYAPDGIDPNRLGVAQVFSGHIHTSQEVTYSNGCVYYVGSPRWRTMSDANVEKYIADVTFEGASSKIRRIDTSAVCRPIGRGMVRTVDDLKALPFASNPKAINHLDLVGPKESLEALEAAVRKLVVNPKIRTIPTDTEKTVQVRESEGVDTALRRFLASATLPYGTSNETIQKMIAERLHAK